MQILEMAKIMSIAIGSAIAVGIALGLVLREIVHHAEIEKRREEYQRYSYYH